MDFNVFYPVETARLGRSQSKVLKSVSTCDVTCGFVIAELAESAVVLLLVVLAVVRFSSLCGSG